MRHEPPTKVEPDPTVAAQLADTVEDATTFYALAGQHENESQVVRDGVRTLDGIDATQLLVSMLDAGCTTTQALRAAWNLPGADHASVVAFLLRDLEMSLPDVSQVLRVLGVNPAERRALIKLLDTGK